MNYSSLVCFDLEMCCWDDGRSPGEIIEIGVAEFNIVTREITRRSQYYITNEVDDISEYCTKLTGITQTLIDKQGRPLETAVQSMVDRYGGYGKVYCAWGRDDQVLFYQLAKKNVKPPFREFINLSTLYKIHQRTKDGKRFGLKKALAQQKLTFEGTQHSAYDDAYNAARLALTFL